MMTDHINLTNLNNDQLRNFNFNEHQGMLTDQQFDLLIKKEGEITFDSQGNFTVINPPRTRDNAFVSFIKSIFVKGYKEQQKQLNRLDQLRQNAHFTELVRSHVKTYASSQLGAAPIAQVAKSINQQIDTHFQQHATVKMEQLKTLVFNAKTSEASVKEFSSSILNDNKGSSSIVYKNESLGLSGFLTKFAPEPNLSMEKLIESIMQEAVRSPQQFAAIDKQEQAQLLKDLLAAPHLSDDKRDQLRQLTGNLTHEIRSKVNSFIQKMLNDGYTPQSIATQVKTALTGLMAAGNGDNAAAFTAVFGQGGTLDLNQTTGLVKASAQELQPPVPSDNFVKLVMAFPDFTSEQIARIISFTKNDPKAIDTYIETIKKTISLDVIKDLFFSLNRQINVGAKNSIFDEAQRFMWTFERIAGTRDLSAGKFAEIAGILTNYYMLNATPQSLSEIDFSKITYTYIPVIEKLIAAHDESLHHDQTTHVAGNKEVPDYELRLEQGRELRGLQSILKAMNEQLAPNLVGCPIKNAEQTTQQLNDTLESMIAISKLNLPGNPPEIMKAASIFPAQIRNGVATLLKGMVKGFIGKNNFYNEDNEKVSIEEIAKSFAKFLKRDRVLMTLINPSFSDRNFEEVSKLFLDDPDISVKSIFLRQKHKIVNNIHEDLQRDVTRNFVTNFNQTDITAIKDQEEKYTAFLQQLNTVDKSFHPYITTFLMQGGAASFLISDLANQNKRKIIPGLNYTDMSVAGLNVPLTQHQAVVQEGNKLKITTTVEISVALTQRYHDLHYSSEKGYFYSIKYETTIDLSKGVDQDGIPVDISTKMYRAD